MRPENFVARESAVFGLHIKLSIENSCGQRTCVAKEIFAS